VATLRIALREWSSTPTTDDSLQGVFLPDDQAVRRLVSTLSQRAILDVTELRHGLQVRTTSWVGRVQIGDLQVTVHPKIAGFRLLGLLRYAYGLRDLATFSGVDYVAETESFIDLLVNQLSAEAQELLSRGLHRRFLPVREGLPLPRGKIDICRLALDGGVIRAALPCTHYPRLEDTVLNRALLAGLYQAVRLTSDVKLKRRLLHVAAAINESVQAVALDRDLLERAQREVNRLTRAYEPALKLIDMLVASMGVSLDEGAPQLRLPGFFFDMNRFFQSLLSRFLHEHLAGYEVQDQFQLRDMMQYVRSFNPKGRKSPRPRPDYVVRKGSTVVRILDAKYRDLWERDLGQDILYQLSIYAMSQKPGMEAVILYPSAEGPRPEARIELRDPVYGGRRAEVVVRAVDLARLEGLIKSSKGNMISQQRASQFAKELVFGVAPI